MTPHAGSWRPPRPEDGAGRVAQSSPRLVWLTVTMTVLTAAVPTGSRDTESMHCISRPGPEADSLPASLSLLNGVVADSQVARDQIALIETICWDKAERMFGVRVSLAVMSVWTEPSPLTVLQGDLRRLVQAQRRHRDQYGEFAAALTQLEGFGLSPRVTVDLSARSGSFAAVGRHNQLDYLCSLEISGADGAAANTPNRPPVCESQHGRGPWGTRW